MISKAFHSPHAFKLDAISQVDQPAFCLKGDARGPPLILQHCFQACSLSKLSRPFSYGLWAVGRLILQSL